MTITPIKLSFSNAYLVRGRKTILVDTGMPGEEQKILRAAANAGVPSAEISLILHTHAHVDHAGSTAALAKALGVPTAVHPADAPMLQAGKMRPLTPLRLEARLIKPMVDRPFPPVRPDLLVDDSFDLSGFGVEGRIVPTPGHTAGSLSLLLADGTAVVGDVLMGGVMGGALFGARPNYHYFAEDITAVRASIKTLLSAGAQTFYVGHGAPLRRDDIEKRFARTA
jgi:hydroxyacylglutathione hydrolase